MKQLLFLLLFPCLALAQYPNNGNQKITLGEQSSADGLVFRGVENDTALITPLGDTSAYIILDTVNNKFYNYNRSTNVWSLAGGGGGSTLDTATMLLPYWRSGRFSGVLPVENGGTGQSTLTANKVMVGNVTSGVLTPTDLHWDNSNALLGIGETSLSTFKLTVKGAFPILFNTTATANTLTYGGTRFFRNTSTLNNGNGFQYSFNDANGNAAEYGYFGGYIIDNTVGSTDGGFIFAPTLNNSRTEAMRILNNGYVGIGVPNPTEKLHVDGNALFTGSVSLGTPLTVASGGTNTTTLTANKVMVGNGTSGVLTPTNLHWDNTNSRLGVNTLNPVDKLDVTGGFKISKATFVAPTSGSGLEWSFRTDNVGYLTAYDRDNAAYRSLSMGLANFNVDTDADGDPNFTVRQTSGEAWIGYTADQGAYKLQINGQPYATSSLFVPSDLRFKENIQPLDKGLEIINKLKPVKFNFISTTENNFSEFDEIGFIAQDVEGALSTELFAKAVVKKLDEDKDDSALGLMTEKLIPILVKAIQEQQALIKALEQRIINLENK
jgi:hypothetical protein